MADEFKITDEIMEKADTYVPLILKEMIASDMARACIKETNLIHHHDGKDQYDGAYGLSPVYCESPSSKARVMMTVLMVYYLHVWDDTPYLCDLALYDQWAEKHVLNQLERFKAGKYREKAFDLIADYKETERYLNSAIYAVLRELNDPVKRFMEAIGEMSSEEGMQNAIQSIREAQERIEEEQERQEKIMRGEEPEEGEKIGG